MPTTGQQGQQGPDIYEQYFAEQDRRQNERVAQAVAVNTGNNPDKVGQAQQLGMQAGVGPEVAMQHMDDIKKSLAVEQVHERNLAINDPILARQLSDPDFAAISHDDLDNLQQTGSTFQRFTSSMRDFSHLVFHGGMPYSAAESFAPTPTGVDLTASFGRGMDSYESGQLGALWRRGQADSADLARIDELYTQSKTPYRPQTWGGDVFGGVAELAGGVAPMLPSMLRRGAQVGSATGAGAAVLGGFPAIPAALWGFGTGAVGEFSGQNFDTISGNAYIRMMKEGVDPVRADWAALSVGLVNTALQQGALRIAGKPLGNLAAPLIDRVVGDAAADALTQPSMARVIPSALLKWTGHTALAAGEMTAQQIVDQVGNDYAQQKGAALTLQDLESPEFHQQLWEGFKQAALTMGLINASTSMIGFSADMARVQKAAQSAQFFEDLSQGAVDSKVRGRNPDSYEQYIANQAQGTPAETIYIDGRQMGALLHQSGLDPDRIERALPGLQQQVAEASAVGGDVEIPTAQYAARLAGTPLGEAMKAHMRSDPDALSATDALELQQKQKELFDQARQEAEQQIATNEDFAKSAKVVEKNIFDQLKATKTMPDDAARTNAQFVRDFVVTQAARQGMTPEAFFDQNKYSIVGGDGGELQQANRGGFDPSSMTTMLGKKADMSTFLHETAHYFLTVMGKLARDGQDASTKEDFGKLLNWFGVKDQAAWDGMSLEKQRKFHEQFAYSYEKYLAEGKAPSIEAQGVFDRFSQWLKRVYKSVRDDVNTIYRQQHGEDLPILTGEVREVMDRMLASDEQIRQAQAIRNMEPVFRSQETSGMNDAEWKAYGDMADTATATASAELAGKSVREMQWLSTAKGRLLKAMQAQHAEIREGVRAEARDELVRQEPVYKAQHFMRTGELIDENGKSSEADIHKMDTEAAKGLLPEGHDIKELFGMTKKGGLSPDEVAAATGFRDGKEMITAILSSPSMKDAVDTATDQRMVEQHGDISTPNGMAAAVEKAVHNEARARVIAFEMRHSFNMSQPERLLVKAAQATARRMIERESFADLNPSAYAAREARAARQAEAAASRGDVEAVGRAKRDQLLQHALTTEALKARDEAQQHLRYLNKFDSPSKAIAKAIGADHMDAINELLAAYGLSSRERYSARSEPMAKWINSQYERTGVMPAVPDELVDRMGKMDWRDMNLMQLRDLRDAVKSLDYTGRRQTEITLEGKQQSVDELVQRVSNTLADMKHTPVTDLRARMKYAKGLDKLSAQFLRLKSWGRSGDAALLKMEQLFQWIDAGRKAGLGEVPIDGPMQSIYRLASHAEGRERAMRAEAVAGLRKLNADLQLSGISLNEPLDVPELPREGTGSRWYRGELIAMALNMGNESNKTKLLRGYGWDEMSAVSAINRLLSPEEMRYVQGIWNLLGSYWDNIRDLQRRQTGVSPQMIEPSALVTKHGTFEGGYYPVVYNDVLDDVQARNQARNAAALFENNYAKPATASGHTIGRTDYVGPLFLDLDVIARHVNQVTHDLAWREAIVDMNKVLTNENLTSELNQVYGREYVQQFRPWLQAMANDQVFSRTGDVWWAKAIRAIRANTTMVGIGFRMSTMTIHGTSALSNSLGELGTKWFAKGSAQFLGMDRFQEARQFVYDRSPEMANRMNEMDRNVFEAIRDIESHENSVTGSSVKQKLVDSARKFAFRGVGMLDMASALPTWYGAYLKGMAHEADGGLGLGEDAAIAYADRSVRNAHGGGGIKDMSAVQRSDAMSLFTMFYSYWNHVYQRQRDIGKGWKQVATGQAAVRDFPKLLARSWFYLVVPALAHTLLSGRQHKDDSLAGYAKESAEAVALSFTAGLPVIRDVANAYVHGEDYKLSPIEEPFRKMIETANDVTKIVEGKEPSKRAFQNAAEAVGYATGLPTAQPAASARFIWNVMDGDVKPTTAQDWWRGVLTGKIN